MFKRKPKAERERLPKILPAECLGERCRNFGTVACDSYFDLLEADGKSGGTNIPPYKDEATFAMYGQVCEGGEKEVLVRIRTQVLAPGVNMMEMIARSGRYGDIPMDVEHGSSSATIETIASSDHV